LLAVLLLLMPLASWSVSTGGLPGCAGLERGSACPMQGTKANCHMTCMSKATQLSLPASLVPVVPVRLVVAGRPGAEGSIAANRGSGATGADGYLPAVFHPPAA